MSKPNTRKVSRCITLTAFIDDWLIEQGRDLGSSPSDVISELVMQRIEEMKDHEQAFECSNQESLDKSMEKYIAAIAERLDRIEAKIDSGFKKS